MNTLEGERTRLRRLLVVCPVFREWRFCERWRLMAELHPDVDVTLLAPRCWIWKDKGNYSFGRDFAWRGEAREEPRFRVRLVDMPQVPHFGWLSWGMLREIRSFRPDMIYHIGNEIGASLTEIILAARMFVPRAKLVAFTMRGLPQDFHSAETRAKWWLVKQRCHAMFCHYPDARRLIQSEGFPGPVYIQTQIGVDARFYRRDEGLGQATRAKYGLGDAFVFGSATRLALEKGVMEILAALPKEGNWKYLMLGSGPKAEEEQIRREVARQGLSGRVILPGLIDWREMPAHWSAMDCMLHVPRTSPTWVDTFPVAVAQAMASSLPVIGNTSGAVPYQLGGEGVVVPEGDTEALGFAMRDLMCHPDKAREIGRRLRERVLRTFDITHLSHCFHATMLDILSGTTDLNKIDQCEFGG